VAAAQHDPLRSPRVYAVVLNWNRYELTRACVESILEADYPDLRIIIVDNASSDGSAQRLRVDFPGAALIANGANLGFARGCNVGIRAALEDPGCAYVLLLNNDATLEPSAIRVGVEAAERDDSVGAVGAKILRSRSDRRIWHAGGRISLWRGAAITRGLAQLDRGQFDHAEYVGFLTGACMLIRRKLLSAAGPLPEEYFFGVEEWDYSLTATRLGMKLLYEPRMLAYHEGDGSHDNYDPVFVYNYYRNKLIFQEKHLPKLLYVAWRIAFRVYGQFLARLNRIRLHWARGDRIPEAPEELAFALRRALIDHRSGPLDEDALRRFAESLARLRGGERRA